MRQVFVDSGHWVALLHPSDVLHERAREVDAQLTGVARVTSDMVLDEVLAYFRRGGPEPRRAAVQMVRSVLASSQVTVVPQTRALFLDAVAMYAQRSDKPWSLTDCASFVIMRTKHIEDALAHDEDFVQAGFRALLRAD